MKKIKKGNLLIHIILILGAVVMILPFVWMVLTSLKTLGEQLRSLQKFSQTKCNLVTIQKYFVYYHLESSILIRF